MSPLLQVARRAQRRWWALALLRLAVAALTGGVGLAALLALARSLGLLQLDLTLLALLGAAATAASLLVGLGFLAFRAPSAVSLATRIDRDAGLHDRLPTALELTVARGEPSLVAKAAIEDALRHLDRAQPRRALPLRWPRWGWALPLAAALLAVALQSAPLPPPPLATPVAPATLVATLSSERLEANVERVVAVLETDPVRGRDPYVQAVAESLSNLAQRVRDGEVEASSALMEFDRLMAHLQRAVAERPEDDPIATLVNRYFDQGTALDDGGRPEEQAGGASAGESAAAPAADRRVEAGVSVAERSWESLLEELERALAAAEAVVQEMPAAMVAESTSGDFFYGIDVDAARERQAAAQRQRGEAQGSPVGGAESSDDRPGDAAGFGVFDGDPDADGGLTGAGSLEDDVVVAGRELEGRRRIEIEGDPGAGAAASARTGGATLDAPLPLHRADEALRLSGASSAYTDVVRAYFMPDAAPAWAGARPPQEEP